MQFKFLENFRPLENVEFRDPEKRMPFWSDHFNDDSRMKKIVWHYTAYEEDFIVSQVGPNNPYTWQWKSYSGSAPTLRDARSAARNAIRSLIIGEARRRYFKAIEDLSNTEGN
jgi:hypothetical protein